MWALGISQTQVSKEDYVKITKTYALGAAKEFQKLAPENEPFNFICVSGEGTTTEPGFFMSQFGRVKGGTEVALAVMREANVLFHASSMRPGIIYPTQHDAIKPYIPVLSGMRKVAKYNRPLACHLALNHHCGTEHLVEFLTELAMGIQG